MVHTIKRLVLNLYGAPYVGAAVGLAVLGVVSSAVFGGRPFGYVFYASFVVWPVAVAAASHHSTRPEYYARMIVALACVGTAMGAGLRAFPDNINLVGMMVSTAALFLMVRTPSWQSTLAAVVVLAVLVLDSRRTLGVSHGAGMLLLGTARFYRQRPKVSSVVAAAAALGALCAAGLATSFSLISSLPGQQYMGSVTGFFRNEQRLDIDGRRAQLMESGINAIRGQPWRGVGGGRYLDHLDAVGVEPGLQVRPHNLPILIWVNRVSADHRDRSEVLVVIDPTTTDDTHGAVAATDVTCDQLVAGSIGCWWLQRSSALRSRMWPSSVGTPENSP